MARFVFDLEANGLLFDASRIHCLVLIDKDTKETKQFGPSQVEQGLKELMRADEVIGHNIIQYDIALASKLYPWFYIREDRVVDTLILSRLLYPDLSDRDRQRGCVEAKQIGSHSLAAWGQRLGFPKAEYNGGWEEFSQEMLDYNTVDVEVTDRLHDALINSKALSPKANVLEHQVAHIVARQEQYGFPFDEAAAARLTSVLLKERNELERRLQDTFQPFFVDYGEFTPKRNNKNKGITAGHPYCAIRLTQFNPGSRQHIAMRLQKLFGWVPTEYTPDGKPKVDETVLDKLPWPEAKLLSEYFLIQKRLGMLSEATNAWTAHVRKGRIHGGVITNGAVTGRATHRNPNLAQVPSVPHGKEGILYGKEGGYGYECRSLFTASRGRVLVGVDVSGLELRCLAHFMAKWDGGAYGKEVIDGDIHTVNQHAAKLPTRAAAKSFIYAFLYGAGNAKLGLLAGGGADDGAKLKRRFLKSVPALAELLEAVGGAATRGYLIGLDGRRLHIRRAFAALNVLLQSAGALACKQWMVEVDQEIVRRGWRHKVQQVVWVHDECQFDCDPDIAEEFGKMCVECVSRAGEFFNFKIPLTGEYKIGKTWAETH